MNSDNHWSKTDKRDEVMSKIKIGWNNLRPNKRTGEYRNCKVCNARFYVRRSHILLGVGKHCSTKCNGISKKSIPEYKHSRWQGDKPSYRAVHAWIKKHYGVAKKCNGLNCNGKSNTYQWANISGEYKRDINDFIELCASCHKLYDLQK